MKKLLTLGLFLTPFYLLSQQVAKNLTASNGTFIGFYEYKPTDYDANPSTRYPLIIFLHGIGERGNGTNNLSLVLGQGVPRLINQGHPMRFYWNGKWETFLVLSPQLSSGYGDWQNFYVEEMISYAKNNMRIDPNRIFLTGLSLGGGGVWRFASQSSANAQELAGIAPVCGTCAMNNACAIAGANLPVWAFHAQDDGIVGVGCTTSSVMSIDNCNPNVKPVMTIYPSGGHFIWDRSYDPSNNWHNINMYEWFLGQNKSLPANILPNARAGSDITISNQPGIVNLNGSSSFDSDGNIARYIWKMKSGPSGTNISSPASTDGKSDVLGLTSLGNYIFELTVFDSRGGSSVDEVTVTVNSTPSIINNAPVAIAGNDQTLTLPSNNVNLSATGSYDMDGSITSWSWSKISGPSPYSFNNPLQPSTTVSGLAEGNYSFAITVTDNAGAQSRDTVSVLVNSSSVPGPIPPVNQAPISKAGLDVTINLPANTVNLNGYGSYDPDGTIQTWLWEKVSGPSAGSIANPNIPFTTTSGLQAGNYQYRLTVSDNRGASASSTVNITVIGTVSSLPPIAKAGPDELLTLPTNYTNLNGYGSYDTDGTIQQWQWTKVSGPAEGTILHPSEPYSQISGMVAGTYTIRLTVTDNSGISNSSTVNITVNSSTLSNAPFAKAGNDVSVILPLNSAILNGYNSYDPDGIIQVWEWTKVSGPAGGWISSPNAGSTSITGLNEGTYTFKLSVIDNSGQGNADFVNVVVASTAGNSNKLGTASEIQEIGIEKIIAFPNPAINTVNLKIISSRIGKGRINLLDINGRLIKTIEVTKTQNAPVIPIDISGLNKGIYIAEFIDDKKNRVVARFIKQ